MVTQPGVRKRTKPWPSLGLKEQREEVTTEVQQDLWLQQCASYLMPWPFVATATMQLCRGEAEGIQPPVSLLSLSNLPPTPAMMMPNQKPKAKQPGWCQPQILICPMEQSRSVEFKMYIWKNKQKLFSTIPGIQKSYYLDAFSLFSKCSHFQLTLSCPSLQRLIITLVF